MLQRIQSIYLSVAAGLLGLLQVFSFGSLSATNPLAEGIFSDRILTLLDDGVLAGLAYGSLGLIVGCIFLFSNYKLQKLTCKIGGFLSVLVSGWAAYLGFSVAGFVVGIGLFLPIVALIFLFLAYKGISADESLIKSSNRIR
jgi:hypothetical protein